MQDEVEREVKRAQAFGNCFDNSFPSQAVSLLLIQATCRQR